MDQHLEFLASPEATEAFGAKLWATLPSRCLVFLHGNLGAGKTTLVRGFLRAAGYEGVVKSPTYNLVEEYVCQGREIYHFDLYRLNDPEELEWIGMRDYLSKNAICFIEWPEQGNNFLPLPDLELFLNTLEQGRSLGIRLFDPLLVKIIS